MNDSLPLKAQWIKASHDAMTATIDATLRAAGLKDRHVIFSIFETTVDGVLPDMSDWMVKHPDFASVFATGKCDFVLAENDEGDPMLTEGHENPTWADILVMGEKSCRARGAPELDHVFLESVEPEGPRRKGIQRYSFCWGS